MRTRTHYGSDYDNKKRLASYWHQVDECLTLGGKRLLMVGMGSGLPILLMQRQGFEVTTVDIEAHLRPTIAADVRQLSFKDRAFDIAVCCEVLEHLPYEFFAPSLRELTRVVRRGVVLSLPDRGRHSTLLPRLLRWNVVLPLPDLRLRARVPNIEHFWEVNLSGYSLSNVQREIDATGLKTETTFRVWEVPYHRFWRLTLK